MTNETIRDGAGVASSTDVATASENEKAACFTPSPWTVGERCGQEVVINAPHGDPSLGYERWKQMATVYGCDEQPVTGGRVMEANARLIAAAPDLYEVAKLVAQHFSDTDAPLGAAARAALAKAEGRA